MKVLFVCMGNICRSPTAQGVVESLATRHADLLLEVDSAGTHAYHVGQAPDRRTQAAAAARGYDLSRQRARLVEVEDFHRFDLLLAMDMENLRNLRRLAPDEGAERAGLFLDYLDDPELREVPDPFYGDDLGFERVLDLVERAAEQLLIALAARQQRAR